MKYFIFLMLVGSLNSVYAQDDCDLKKMQSSKMDISLKDTEYLKRIMSFSYDKEVDKYAPRLKSSYSGVYYKNGNKNEPLMTFLFSSYKDPQTAKQAAEFLKTRWIKNRSAQQYDVAINGSDVVWFGNNSLSGACFKKVVAAEKSQVFKK